MGATPCWFTLACLTLPERQAEWLKGFSKGLFAVADEFSCDLVGGDTTRGPLTISIQVHGTVEKNKALLRSGAAAGDLIAVTGMLGKGAYGLAALTNHLPESHAHLPIAFKHFIDWYYRPQPRIREGLIIANLASAAIDISDGLAADLNHIAKASAVKAVLSFDELPTVFGDDQASEKIGGSVK